LPPGPAARCRYKERQDAKILGPASRFLRSDDVAQIGNHDLDVVNEHAVCVSEQLCVAIVDAIGAEGDVELAVGADEVPGLRTGEGGAVLVEVQPLGDGLGADPGTEVLQGDRESVQVLRARLGRQVDVPSGGDRDVLGDGSECTDHHVADLMLVENGDDRGGVQLRRVRVRCVRRIN
jgi:hypothetical protein